MKKNEKTITVKNDDDALQILIAQYQMADNQLEMRIQQRDTFAIQLMAAIGVIIGTIITIDNWVYRGIGVAVISYVTTYFCSQILSSYDVHHRLGYYMKNVLEFNMENYLPSHMCMWEEFCALDRNVNSKSRIGGRENFFKMICAVVGIGSMIVNVTWCITNSQYLKLYSVLILIFQAVATIWSISTVQHHSRKISYEEKMNNKIAKRGYINLSRGDAPIRKPAVFVDRDGTIIVDKVETHLLEDLEFFDDIDCLTKLADAGLLLVIVTNQSGVGKGHYSIEEMTDFNNLMIQRLQERGIAVDALYYCPHLTSDNCQCKKPKDGMLRRAAMELNIDLTKSYMIGDQNSDIMAGINAGLKACYAVPTGLYPQNSSGKYEIDEKIQDKTIVCEDLQDAVDKILQYHFISVNDNPK